MDINLKDKKIILTGGSRGIGLSILEKLYSLGSQILIIGSNKENLEKTKSKFPKILIEAFDLADHHQITNLFKKLHESTWRFRCFNKQCWNYSR